MNLKDALEIALKSNFTNIKVFEDHIEVENKPVYTITGCYGSPYYHPDATLYQKPDGIID